MEDGYKEEALETELEKQLTRFLLELGTGFAYMGRQKQLKARIRLLEDELQKKQ